MKIEEYLESLSKKEMIYLSLSLPIAVFVIYYNFVYPKLEKKDSDLKQKEEMVKKELIDVSSKIRKVKSSKKIITPIRKKLENLEEDYKYIDYSFRQLDAIKLNNAKIYSIFTKLLNKANSLGLAVSFKVDWNKKRLEPFSQYIEVNISGKGDYIDIVRYLQFIDHLKSLVNVNTIEIGYKLDNPEAIQKSLINKNQKSKSSFSFVLTKYSADTLDYLKLLVKNNNLSINMRDNDRNPSYLNVGFRGDYVKVKSVMNILQNTQKQKNKKFIFKDLKADLKFVNDSKSNKSSQQFTISLQIVGVK